MTEGEPLNKLKCPECATVIETNDTEVECTCGKRLRIPTVPPSALHGGSPTSATATATNAGSWGGTLYRWEARRSDATLAQASNVRMTFYPIFPTAASVSLALIGTTLGSMAASFRQSKQIRREVKYVLKVAPRWRAQESKDVRLVGNTISLPFNEGSVQRDLATVQYWAIHPRKRQGILLRFGDTEGLLRVKMSAPASDQLANTLGRLAPAHQGVWKPEPIDHPGLRRLMDARLKPSGGLLNLISKAVAALLWLLGIIFWPVLLLWGLTTLILCRRDFDTFKPGWRTYVCLATPIVGFVIVGLITLSVLASGHAIGY